MKKIVIFDLDGTLSNNVNQSEIIYQRISERYNMKKLSKEEKTDTKERKGKRKDKNETEKMKVKSKKKAKEFHKKWNIKTTDTE